MTTGKSVALLTIIIMWAGLGVTLVRSSTTEPTAMDNTALRPSLNVTLAYPEQRDMPLTLTANGSVAAWQEAIIGAEVSDLRLSEVRAQVGESVRKGQVLAVFADDSVRATVAQAKAGLAEAEANLGEARLNASRARQVSDSGVLSAQQVTLFLTLEKTALAKVQSTKAQLDSQLLRLKHTRVIAGDDGIISSRTATLGAVATPSQELFRLIRQKRLEWRAEVTATEMAQLKPGVSVSVSVAGVANMDGTVRLIAPTLDTQSRNGLVYVDLPNAFTHGLRAGMFAQGEFYLGNSPALTVPQGALSLREGFSYIFRLAKQPANGQATVTQVKVQLGRRTGDHYEILSGISLGDAVVAGGAGFLADGDTVRVVKK
jgi:RND family efflux transporter MFP subunit